MSTNNANPPGDMPDPRSAAYGASDPLAGNPYSTQYQQAPAPDLDANAPLLRSNDLRRMNRRALFFLAAIVVLLMVLAYFLISNGSQKVAPVKPREETITVPQAPSAPRQVAQPTAPPLTAPIPLMPSTPLPPLPQQQDAAMASAHPHGPSLMERRMMSGDDVGDQTQEGGTSGAGIGLPGGLPGGMDGNAAMAKANLPSQAGSLHDPDTLMLRGTYIRCVLETHIVTDIPGFTSCIVTEPIYSFNGRKLLLPKGSKVMGKYDTEPTGNRVAVIWDRIVTPTGIDVSMASPGVDNLGGSGHPGHLNSHWGSRIGSALLISMFSDAFAYEAAVHAPRTTSVGLGSGVVTQTPFQSNTAQTLQNLAQQAVQKSANRAPTVTINQGTVVTIYVAKDVDFRDVLARY